ncbi:MAG: type I-B CRISPR-associated protein Cas5b [Candidatus Heimdallarchaeota archaeon]
MKFVVFELSGKYAHFKVPESTRGNFTFPFPPRTALMGLIAGILGIQRNSYWQENLPFYSAKIAVEILSTVVKNSLKVNYTQTKTTTSLRKLGVPITLLIPKDPGNPKSRGFISQFKLDLLKDVHYRIYVSINNEELHKQLEKRLQEKKYVYPPYFGHVNFFANLDYLGNFEAKYLSAGEHPIDGLIAASSLMDENDLLYQSGRLIVVFNVPMVMKTIKYEKLVDDCSETFSSKIVRLENIILQVENGKQLKMRLKENSSISISFSKQKKNLVLLPSSAVE